MAAADDDWRLQGQERYLKGVVLHARRYTAWSESWEHDHCQFCWAKFMDRDLPNALRIGYSTTDRYRWICARCFEDFAERFEWTVGED